MKFNFEMPSAPEPKQVESKEESQSVFERLYKSKPARAVAFAAALFGAGAISESLSSKHPKNEAAIASAVEKDEHSLEGLSEKFNVEVQVPGGDQTILHIAQMHNEGSLKEFGGVENIVKSQKHIEELLTFLKEKGIADTVYQEGVNSELLARIDEVRHMDLEMAHTVLKNPLLGYDEATQAILLYSAQCELSKRADEIDSNYQLKIKSGFPKVLETESRIQALRNTAKDIASDELIRGDNVYVWGAGLKMYSEGKINLNAVQSDKADEETMAPYTLKEVIPAILDAGYKPRFRHAIREGAAVDMIAKDAPTLKEKVIPLIYGSAHNFTGAVKDWDQKAGANKFGLTRVEVK